MTFRRFYRYLLVFFIVISFSFASREVVDSSYKLVLFEGSDWCVNCIRFDKTVLKNTYFIEFMESQNIAVERVDFPQRKKLTPEIQAHNASMAEKYGFQGIFPTILLVKPIGNEVISLEYHDQGALEFIKQIKTNIAVE